VVQEARYSHVGVAVLTNLVDYNRIEPAGGSTTRVDLLLMKAITKLVGPLGRVRGIGVVSRWLDSGDALAKVRLNDDAVFVYPAYDPYWSYYLLLKKSFERQLQGFLSRITGCDYTFIDCGSNFGYWSALLSSRPFGGHRCIAIEASRETYPVLQKTSECNDSRIECLHHAVYSSSGLELSFTEGARHAGRHLVDGDIENLDVNKGRLFTPAESLAEIDTISIDDIASRYCGAGAPVLVKLDVEGAEVEALQGASNVAAGDAVFVYEDFGTQQEVTGYMLENDFQVFRPRQDGGLIHVENIAMARAMKGEMRKDDHNYVAWKGRGAFISSVKKLVGKEER